MINVKHKPLTAINWNVDEDMGNVFWDTGIAQFWTESEFHPSRDIKDWNKMTDKERDTYKKVLAGLTGLDTKQGGEGMNLISYHEPRGKFRGVYGFAGGMEFIHEKSYSYIFTSLISTKETDYLLNEWVEEQEHLAVKSSYISHYYDKLLTKNPSLYDRYMAKVASAYLESFLFYSGFYYPLLLAGQGRMVQSGKIIYKITQDEAYHGSAVGLTAQYDYDMLTDEEKEKADKEMYALLDKLYENEVAYTKELYDDLGLTEDVINYVQYNANRALNNLGRENYYNPAPFNPIVENQVNTEKLTNGDFFSTKTDYLLAGNIKDIKDGDFVFEYDINAGLVDEFL